MVDFETAAQGEGAADPWEPIAPPTPVTSASLAEHNAPRSAPSQDGWSWSEDDLDGSPATSATAAAADDGDDFVPFADAADRATTPPWPYPSANSHAEEQAWQEAAALATSLDVRSRAEQDAALRWLADFFATNPHPATFRALLALAEEEALDPPTLRAMVDLREVWAERPDWWLVRRWHATRAAWGRASERLEDGRTAMSWRLAYALCHARALWPADAIIDEDWLAEWHALRPGDPGYVAFTAFLAEKARTLDAEALDDGLWLGAGAEDEGSGHRWGWCGQLPAESRLVTPNIFVSRELPS